MVGKLAEKTQKLTKQDVDKEHRTFYCIHTKQSTLIVKDITMRGRQVGNS